MYPRAGSIVKAENPIGGESQDIVVVASRISGDEIYVDTESVLYKGTLCRNYYDYLIPESETDLIVSAWSSPKNKKGDNSQNTNCNEAGNITETQDC